MIGFYVYAPAHGGASIASGSRITFDDRNAYVQAAAGAPSTRVQLLRTAPFVDETSARQWLKSRRQRRTV
ncbi:hypothetical protein EPN42_04540 [bacterium]|nr:MAG: hypothetical protein EPN42_04540 [bacterium]